MDRKSLGFNVHIEIDFFFVRADNDLLLVWGWMGFVFVWVDPTDLAFVWGHRNLICFKGRCHGTRGLHKGAFISFCFGSYKSRLLLLRFSYCCKKA